MTDIKDLKPNLRWVEEEVVPVRPRRDEEIEMGDVQRTVSNTIFKKFLDNPFVPLGLAATTVCLGMGLLNLSRGDSKKQQLFMRGRVFFQAFTFGAMFLGVYFTARQKDKKKAARIAASTN